MLSNSLCLLAEITTQAASAPTEAAGAFGLTIMAVGIIALAVSVFRRATHPDKLTLENTPGRPNTLTPAHLLVPLAAYVLAMTVVQLLAGSGLGEESSELKIAAVTAAQLVAIPASLAMAYVGFSLGLQRGLGLSGRRWLNDSLRAMMGVLAVYPVCIGLLALVKLVAPEDWFQPHEVLDALKKLPLAWKPLAVFSAVVLAPLTEELFFRGLIQSMLRRYLRGPWAAVLITAALFAAAHIKVEPAAVPSLLVLGIVLGYNYERTGRLTAPILMHSLFNLIAIVSYLLNGAQ